MLRPFLIALQFLTRIPVPAGRLIDIKEDETGQSLLFYPVVGLIIGLLLAAIARLANIEGEFVSGSIVAAIVLLFWILVTGAIHLDGLADSADAWIGGLGDKERTLAIMKDPYCGPAAVVVLIAVLLAKFSALQILTTHSQWMPLILALVLSRSAVLLLFITTPYVRENGLGSVISSNISRKQAWIVLLLVTAGVFILAGTAAICMLGAILMTFFLLRKAMMHRIGGSTGDTSGALIELTEMTVLIAAVYCL